jgi:Xaa-Pro aminopeptidase
MTRIEKLRESLQLKDDQCALISSDINRAYFSRFADTDGYLLVFHDSAVLLSDSRYFEAAKAEAKDAEVVLLKNQLTQLPQIITGHGVSEILLEKDVVTLSQFALFTEKFPEKTVVGSKELSEQIKKLREIKDDKEIAFITAAQRIAERSLRELLPEIVPGIRERDIAAKLEFLMRKNGSDGASFDTIALAGKNTSKPHGVPSDYAVKSGDFVLLDFGATKGGYHSDMTRTFCVGSPTEKMRKVYETVLEAQKHAFLAIDPNKECS